MWGRAAAHAPSSTLCLLPASQAGTGQRLQQHWGQQQRQRHPHRCRRSPPPVAAAAGPGRQQPDSGDVPDASSSGGLDAAGAALAAEFAALVNEQLGSAPPLLRDRRPTHMMSPTATICAQMEALQRNDWPEVDSGVLTAFQFAMPEGAEELIAAQGMPQRVRSWAAREEWLPLPDFSNQLHSPPYALLLGCDSWRMASQLVFPSQRHQSKAVAAVEVVPASTAAAAAAAAAEAGGGEGAAGEQQAAGKQLYTFCLERVTQGPYKNCWMTVGVRVGDYANE